MVKLSKGEQQLYDCLLQNIGEDVPIAKLVKIFYQGRKKPKHKTGSVAALMRTLMLKSEVVPELKMILRTSRLGTGATATYKMENKP